jgi:hypothetical protein
MTTAITRRHFTESLTLFSTTRLAPVADGTVVRLGRA